LTHSLSSELGGTVRDTYNQEPTAYFEWLGIYKCALTFSVDILPFKL